MAKFAYGEKEKISNAIKNGIIPKDCIIITKDDVDPELLFYNSDGELSNISERTRFTTITEAQQWVKKYPSKGLIFTIHNGSEWAPYIVDDNNKLKPISQNVISDITDIKRIDGNVIEI